jgi:hypothetical protein
MNELEHAAQVFREAIVKFQDRTSARKAQSAEQPARHCYVAGKEKTCGQLTVFVSSPAGGFQSRRRAPSIAGLELSSLSGR